MKTLFLDDWSKRRETADFVGKRHEIKLTPEQLSTLHDNSDVRAALQGSRVASLLPPVGTEVFRPFTKTSRDQIKKLTEFKKNKQADEDHSLKPAPELESEKALPFFYGAPPAELRNVPLEDPDPYYQSQKTFVVVDAGNAVTRFNAGSSCFLFTPLSLFRRGAIKILNHKLFSGLVCLTLIVNFFFFWIQLPWDLILELVFLSVYTLEAVLKILSRGFCLGRFTYLRDSWNRLDLVIIITGFAFCLVRQLWFFKALRFVKLLGLFPATRRTAKTFGRTLNRLWDVLLLTLLVLCLLSIIGTGLLGGSLRNRCVRITWRQEMTNSSDLLDANYDTDDQYFDFHGYINNPENHYYREGEAEAQICGNASSAASCPYDYLCIRTGSNPDFGLTNFDHFGFSFLSTLRILTRDFWEAVAEQTMAAEGQSIIVYFVALFLFSFFLTSFVIAAFTISFTEQTEREVREVKQDKSDYDRILAALKDQVDEGLPEKKDPEQRFSCWRRWCSCDCCDPWVRFKNGLQRLVLDPSFDLTVILLIIINIVFLSSVHYPMSERFERFLITSEFVFMIIFFLEVVLKILALGPYQFFEVNWHYFDTILVFLTLVQFVVVDLEGLGLYFTPLRLFRLGRWWPGLHKWMRLAWAGLCSLWTLALVLVTLFFSVFGNLEFSRSFQQEVCRISDDCELPRWNWSDLFHSFMMVTRALFGEWVETLWLCLATSNPFICSVFYLTLLIVGNFLILAIFLTLLMKWISDKLAPKDEEKLQISRLRFCKMLKVCGISAGEKAKTEEPAAAENTDHPSVTVTIGQTEENGTQSSTLPIGEAQNFQKMKETEATSEDPESCCCQKCYSCCPALNLDKSQGCGRVWANLRRSTFNIVRHPYFNNFILFFILVSSFVLVFEDKYLPTNPFLEVFLEYLDHVITYLFVVEVLFKWIGLGLNRYFKDGWCWLDFVVTLACVLSVAAQASGLGPALVSLKALRPLRILAHIKGTRRSVCSLLKIVPSLLDVLLVTLTVSLFFGIMFIHLYAGKFSHCLNTTSSDIFHHMEVANKSTCLTLMDQNATVRWSDELFNFNSMLEAYLSLLSMATLKGWIDILYAVTDATWVEDQPQFQGSLYHYVFFVLFFLFGCFFCLIHVVKVLLDAYSAQTLKVEGRHLFLTERQMRRFDDVSFRARRPLAPCPRPKGGLRGRLFYLVSRESFEWVMQAVILVGVVALAVEDYDMSSTKEMILYRISFTIIVVFLLEFILKICAFGKSYFHDKLNVLDFVVLVAQIISLFVTDLLYKYFAHINSMNPLHLLRVVRLCRIIHRFPCAVRLRVLFVAWTKSLPAVFNLALVLFVLMFSFASFGTFHFSHLKKTHSLTHVMNFETFSSSLAAMWTTTTWAGWDGLIRPGLLTPPDCDAPVPELGDPGNCGSRALSVTFFVTYLCLSSFLVLMMLLVMLVDLLNVFAEMSRDPLSPFNLSHFFKTWGECVPHASPFIQRSQIPGLCERLKKPLRIQRPSELGLELGPEERVHCRDVLLALSVQASGGADRDSLRARIQEKVLDHLPNDSSQESCEMTDRAVDMDQKKAASDETEAEE